MLQKPLKPGRRFSRLKLTQAKVATKSDSGPITEVTDELSARSCDPHILTRKTRLRPRNFLITVEFLSAQGIDDALVSLPVAIAVSMLFAWLTGIVCLRTKGAYFIRITFAFGQMICFVATLLAPYGGDNGLTI